MEKVLQISMGEEFGGIEKIELEWFKNINSKIKFDFLTPNNTPLKKYEKQLQNLGGNAYNLNISRQNIKSKIIYAFRLYKFLKKKKYNILHINSEAFFFSFHVAVIAKICKVKKIIVHSHNTPYINKCKKILIKILNPLYRKLANEYLSCSKVAQYSLFTKRFINKNKIKIIKNGIDINKFKFDEKIRNEYRKKYNLEGKTVYGHVGRFANQKNHTFLIDIFYEIQKMQKNSVLLLIGDGKQRKEIEEKVKKLNISEKVIFLGFRDDVSNLMNCMDIFIFPSLYEGLGISVIEAQTNGLITYCSNTVPIEANISSNFKYFDLKESSYNIAKNISNEKLKLNDREKAYKDTIKKGYDIKLVAKILTQIYEKI